MLHAWRHPHTGELRLYVRGVSAEAWIGQDWSESHPIGPDWVLWVRRGSAPATPQKCQLSLEIESRLRGWLLQRYRRRLLVTSFRELCEIARTEGSDAGDVRRRTRRRPDRRRLTRPYGRGV